MVGIPTNKQGSRGLDEDSLLSASASLFAEKGYRATTLDDIARALNVKKATLYHYIRSKEQLLTGIYARIFDRIEAVVRPIASQPLSANERLRRMIHAHLEVVAAESAMLAVVFQEESELDPANRALFQKRKQSYERIFEAVVEEGQQDRVLRPLSPRVMVRAVLGMCNWLYQWYRPERHSWPKIASELLLLIESGWLADHDSRQGAWIRPDTVGQALEPPREAMRKARNALDELSIELTRAADRLQDGVAGP